jgi:hypothetical protein
LRGAGDGRSSGKICKWAERKVSGRRGEGGRRGGWIWVEERFVGFSQMTRWLSGHFSMKHRDFDRRLE